MQLWSDHMSRYRILRKKSNVALFNAARTDDGTNNVMEFFDGLIEEDAGSNGTAAAAALGPLPAHFSGANQGSTSRVLDPKKVVGKGAPSNKRLKRFYETLRKN
ncbi:hypothetical protein ACP4OV_014159 [Aristida adscensionis]